MRKLLPDFLIPTTERFDVSFERGNGMYLFGSDGRRYLDFFAGVAVSSLGHAHPHLVETLRRHADMAWHVGNPYRSPETERLAERLVEHSFADRCFFCNSGLEAAEAAIKLARLCHHSEGSTRRVDIITVEGAFHGRSLATIAAGNKASHLEGFGPRVPGFKQVRAGDLGALRAAVDENTAAVMLEPVQGEGGVREMPRDYLIEIRRICDQRGVLLVFDEVQSGIGRTGRLFAYEWSGVLPDIMMLAKGLGGGFPIGAALATERVASAMKPGKHGSTFGGNPLATAIGNAVLDVVLAPGFLPRVERVSRLLWQRLEAFQRNHADAFTALDGKGLMLGLTAVAPAKDCVSAVLDAGMITHVADRNMLRLLPPLIVEESHVDEALACLEVGVAALVQRGATALL